MDIKKKLYFLKEQKLFYKGVIDKKIVEFDEEFYNKLSNTYFNCIPIYFHIKYLKPNKTMRLGKCFDRSLYMFFCFDNALLVRGNLKELEYNYGKDHSRHGWIEIDNYVYDPSLLLRYDKDLYYKMYGVTNINKCNLDEYLNNLINKDFYYNIVNTKIDDFKINGNKRLDLSVTMPLIIGIAKLSHNQEFIDELNDYLNLIEYDEKQIYDELNKTLEIKKEH